VKNKKHILVVDDVTTNLKCLGEILRDSYSLSMAKSGEQALSMAEKIHPDIILLDIKMPIMDGFETMSRLLENSKCSDIPVIFLTADKDNENEIKALRLGARDFIRKPYEPEVMISRIQKVLDQEEKAREMALMAYRDNLTGVWNRQYIKLQIEKAIADKQTGSLLIFDLDNFKGINDKYGHVVGDAALVAFANTLSGFVHKDDIVSRVGGDEFIVYLKNSFGRELLAQRIDTLIKQVEKELCIIKADESVSSVSVGISAFPFDGKSFIELYNNADKALYFVKRNGKSGFHFYDSSDDYGFSADKDVIVDISGIRESIDKTDKFEGPLKVSHSNFGDIYELLKRNYQAVGSDIHETVESSAEYVSLNITDSDAVEKVLTEVKPDVVVHCAAWTAVDAAEDEENKAKVKAINVDGTKNIAEVCKKLDSKMIYISTDYVFNGQGTEPWQPDCKDYAPLNVYGQSKLDGELAVSSILDRYFIVRIAWVFGKNGNNFIKTMLNAGKKFDTLRVVNDQVGTPTYTFDLARLLVDMAESDKYGYYHATNEGGYISWYDFTCEIFKQAGYKNTVNPVTTEEYGLSKAARPFNSRLDRSKLVQNGFKPLPAWQDALSRYLKEIDY